MGKRGIVSWDPMGLEGPLPHYVAHKGLEFFTDPTIAPTVPHMNVDPDPQILRMWALFWDEISFPVWDDAILGTSDDVTRLWDEGIMFPFPINREEIDGIIPNRPHSLGTRTAFIQFCAQALLEEEGLVQWSVELKADKSEIKSDFAGRDILVSLYDAIPIPSQSVSLKRTLDFKRQRNDELIALRAYIEDLYQKILNAGDGPLALNTEKDRLESGIRDYLSAMNERNFHVKWASLQAQIKWEFQPATPMIGAAIGYVLGGPAMAAIGGLSSAFVPKIEISTAMSVEGAKLSRSPFAYVGSIHKFRR